MPRTAIRALLVAALLVLGATTAASAQDADLDGVLDGQDNCPNVANPDQLDYDVNAVGDACQDADGDGVFDDGDACPGTAMGAVPDASGCSSADLVRRPDLLLDPVRAGLVRVAEQLRADPDLDRVTRRVEKAIARVDRTVEKLHQGRTCGAARAYRGTLRRIGSAQRKLDRVKKLTGRKPVYPPAGALADVTETELMLSLLAVRATTIDGALEAAVAAGDVVDGACRGLLGRGDVRGIIQITDDADRRLTLDNGLVVAFPGKRFPGELAEGVEVLIRKEDYEDGSSAGTTFKPGSSTISGSALKRPVPRHSASCLALAIAPVQRFPPEFPGPWETHSPAAYRTGSGLLGGVLLLEGGMRVAAEAVPCAPTPGVTMDRHSLRIEFRCGKLSWNLLAPDLEAGEIPVRLPRCDGLASLSVTERSQNCTAGPPLVCSDPEPVGPAQILSATVPPRNHYCSVEYEQRFFAIEDHQTTHRVGRVTGLDLHSSLPAGTGLADFAASGYGIGVLGGSLYPQLVADIMDPAGSGTPSEAGAFAIYSHMLPGRDFYRQSAGIGLKEIFQRIYQQRLTGVDRPSGIAWPHVRGARGGEPFLYSCGPPRVVRDVLGDPAVSCGEDTRSFYRSLYRGSSRSWEVGRSPCNAQDVGHCDGDETCACSQKYAYDIGAPWGTPIFAARGGVVIKTVKDSVSNGGNCRPAPVGCGAKEPGCPEEFDACVDHSRFGRCSCKCKAPSAAFPGQPRGCDIGNWMVVRHTDESMGIYFHMQTPEGTTDPPITVDVGDRIPRGKLVGYTGNTGHSYGAHVHFETKETLDNASQGVLMRWQTRKGLCSNACGTSCLGDDECPSGGKCECRIDTCLPIYSTEILECWVPQTGDVLCDV